MADTAEEKLQTMNIQGKKKIINDTDVCQCRGIYSNSNNLTVTSQGNQ